MTIKYEIDQKLFCLDVDGVNPCTISECTISKSGPLYKIETPQGTKRVQESSLAEKLTKDTKEYADYVFYLEPIGIKDEYNKTARGFHTYKSHFKYYNVYKLTSADIGIFRKPTDKLNSYIDVKGIHIGKIETRVLEKIGVETPRVTDTEWFKIDEEALAKAIAKFNDTLNNMMVMEFLEPVEVNSEEQSHRIKYHNKIDKIILKLNPNIKEKTFKRVDGADEMYDMKVCGTYALNNNFVIVINDNEPPKTINYRGMGEVGVKLELAKEYKFTDTDVLPSYKIYDIMGFENVGVEELSKLAVSANVQEIVAMAEYAKSTDGDELLSSLRYQLDELSPTQRALYDLIAIVKGAETIEDIQASRRHGRGYRGNIYQNDASSLYCMN